MATYKNTRKKYPIQDLPMPSVEDRQAFYENAPLSSAVLAARWLRLSSPISDDLILIEAARSGIKKSALLELAKMMGLDINSLSALLHISSRTFQRIAPDATLDVYSSEQAIEMALVLAKATQVFSDETSIRKWLNTPLLALNGNTPVSILDTGFGVKMVLQTLGRIEHGVYS